MNSTAKAFFKPKLSDRNLSNKSPLDSASLCSLAIALWGYQTGLIAIAIPLILIVESRRVIKRRWEISLSDLQEAAKLCAALLAILFVIIATIKKSVFIYTLFQWLPVAGLPLLIAQIYGLGVRELLVECFEAEKHPLYTQSDRRQFDLSHLYFWVCIVAASATESDRFVFYAGATLLVGLFLWPLRPRRTAPVLWLLLFCFAVGLGFVGHRQLNLAQRHLEARAIAMIGSIASGGPVNPDGNTTRMGSVGRLKLSNRIAFRVQAEPNQSTAIDFPLLLQEATYNQYQLSTWNADNSVFNDVPPGKEDGDWVLGTASEQDSTITISTDLERGNGILTLPRTTSAIKQLLVEELQRNQYGAVQVDAKGSTAYQVQFNPSLRSLDARPTAADLQIPDSDRAAIEAVLAQLDLDPLESSDSKTADKIIAYFQDFQYSLDSLRPPSATAAVSDFLLNTRAGHCEYFASATALLLRGAGIPARYAVGYSVHEFSPIEGQYIVRSRDAHAWTLAYIDGRWQSIDTTPPDWAAQESAMASPLQIVGDLFAFISFQTGYRIRQLGELGLKEVLAITIPLFCYLLWRSIQVFQGQRKANEFNDQKISSYMSTGLDSELYQIETYLKARGLERSPAESFLQWGDRLRKVLSAKQYATLQELLSLHYRYRFDPQGLNQEERQCLRALSKTWLDSLVHSSELSQDTAEGV